MSASSETARVPFCPRCLASPAAYRVYREETEGGSQITEWRWPCMGCGAEVFISGIDNTKCAKKGAT
jgi:hypothetical protein